jgi:AhpD family alkylhydroperoxidase
MMIEFELHDPSSAPEGGRPILEGVAKSFGFAPNLIRTMVESPAVAEGYLTLARLFGGTEFTAAEQQVVLLAVSFENACGYCMAAHSGLAAQSGLDEASVGALRAGTPLADPRLEQLRLFATAMVRRRGFVTERECDAFLAAGYTRRSILDVILGVAAKTLSNYVNHVAATPLDAAFESLAWADPRSSHADPDHG